MSDALGRWEQRVGMEIFSFIHENTPDEDWPTVYAAWTRREIKMEYLGGTRLRVMIAGRTYQIEISGDPPPGYAPPPGHERLN
jgi:hypothetical protein